MRIRKTLTLVERLKKVGPEWAMISAKDYGLNTVRSAVFRLNRKGENLECRQDCKKGISKVRRISNDTATV